MPWARTRISTLASSCCLGLLACGGARSQPSAAADGSSAGGTPTVIDETRPQRARAESKPVKESDADQTDAPVTCIARYEFDHSSSPRQEFTAAGGKMPDFPKRYRAEFIDPDTFVPAKSVERFEIGETPLLWFTPNAGEAVVNAAVLSDLTAADPLSMGSGDRAVIGVLNELGQGKIVGRELLEFLMQSQMILSYVHIGSEVCLESEQHPEAGAYKARVSGVHTFFTNQENREEFAFEFELTGSGELAVRVD
jgi:hypothetical protein